MSERGSTGPGGGWSGAGPRSPLGYGPGPFEQPPADEGRDVLPIVLGVVAALIAIAALVAGALALGRDNGTPSAAGLVVGSENLADGAVVAGKVADQAIATPALADGAVTNDKLADGSVGPAKLADAAVTPRAIADAGVTRAKINDGAVSGAKIADGAIGAAKIAEGAIGDPALVDGAVGARALADGSITPGKVVADSLTGDQIDESTLGTVPSAQTAEVAKSVEGLDLSALGLAVQPVRESSDGGPASVKGPIVAACPEGTQVVSGGASLVGPEGETVPFALTSSTISGNGWQATAQTTTDTQAGWRLDVTALCASQGG